MSKEELLKASDIAILCQVDLKTVHNWCEFKGMPHFRTPGRHLRFRKEEINEWLRKFGYPIQQDKDMKNDLSVLSSWIKEMNLKMPEEIVEIVNRTAKKSVAA